MLAVDIHMHLQLNVKVASLQKSGVSIYSCLREHCNNWYQNISPPTQKTLHLQRRSGRSLAWTSNISRFYTSACRPGLKCEDKNVIRWWIPHLAFLELSWTLGNEECDVRGGWSQIDSIAQLCALWRDLGPNLVLHCLIGWVLMWLSNQADCWLMHCWGQRVVCTVQTVFHPKSCWKTLLKV